LQRDEGSFSRIRLMVAGPKPRPRRVIWFFYDGLRSAIEDRGGAAAVTLALAMTIIAGLAGLGTEAANWYFTQRAMQGAADAAAHTAAAAKSNGAGSSAFTTQAKSIAANFNFSSGSGATVTVNNPPASGNHTSNSDAIEVIISEPMPRLLSSLFISTGPTIAARSVALANPTQTGPACVLTLDTNSETSMSLSGNPALTFNSCSLWVNSAGTGALTLGGSSSISANAAYIVGTVSGSGLTTTNGIYTHVDPHVDPYASAAVPSYTGCNQNNYKITGHTTDTISPSAGTPYVFCNGLQVMGGSTINLCPGTYIIDQGTLDLKGGATFNAPPSSGCSSTGGVTIVLTNHTTSGNPADIDFGANSTVNITAPTTGSLAGLAIFQDRRACGSCSATLIGGSSQNITGAIYFPDNSVQYGGGATTGGAVCTQLIAYQITFKGNSKFNSSCSSAGTKPILVTTSQLVE
jgi:Flp pilus assembly protein TadG